MLNHLAIIPDGNRRWASAHLLLPWHGHKHGLEKFWEVSEASFENGVNFVTIWAASYDNLVKRSKTEIKFLFKLLAQELANDRILETLLRNKIKFNLVGQWQDFITDAQMRERLQYIFTTTKDFTSRQLTILFAYDGQKEMLAAMQNLQNKNGISADSLRQQLWTGFLPDVDLVVRTGGEPHWSAGFMMWLTANSQFYFTEMLWPEFGKIQIKKAIENFNGRQRRLGK